MTAAHAATGAGAAARHGARLDARLLPAALAAWAAAAVLVAVPAAVAAAAAAAAAVTAAVLVGRRRAGRAAPTAAVVCGAVCVVAASVLSAGVVRGAGLLPALTAQSAVVVLEGRAASDATRVRPRADGADAAGGSWSDGPRWVVHLDAERVTGRGSTSGARAPVLVIGGEGWRRVRRGDAVRVVGRLAATPAGDPAVALLLASRAPRTAPPARGPDRWGQRLRAGLVSACSGLPADARGLLPGLVVGDTSQLPDDLDTAMRSTGLTHLTAVSGGNTALVSAAVLGVAAALGAGRRLRLLLAGAALLAFTALAGGEPSVLRAAVMGGAVLVGSAASRGSGGPPALAVAVCGLLVADPWLGRSAGFALSVVATGALLLLVPAWVASTVAGPAGGQRPSRLPRRLAGRFPSRVRQRVAGALLAPVAAQLACGPLVLLLAPGVPLLAVPANLLAAPAVAPATVLGLAATVLEPLWPAAAAVAARAGGPCAQWVALVARTGAAVPGSTLPWPQGPLPALELAGTELAAVLLLGALARQRSAPRG